MSDAAATAPASMGHNGGPPLDDPHVPEWGSAPIHVYFRWKAASRAAWRNVPRELMLRRLRKAASLGLTYREYTLEILEYGRYLQAKDAARIAEIIAARGNQPASPGHP